MTPGKLTKSQKSGGASNNSENERRRSIRELNKPLQSSNEKAVRELPVRPSTSVSGKHIVLMRSERVLFEDEESLDNNQDCIVYPSTAPEARRSVDVVVDVHNESKGSEPNLAIKKSSKPRNAGEDANWSGEGKKRTEAFARRKKRRDIEQGNAWEVEESIETIKEFEETTKVFRFSANKSESPIESIGNSPHPSDTRSSRNNLDNSNSGESCAQQFGSGDKFIVTSRENSVVKEEISKVSNSRFIEEPKRTRKRWSKDEKNLNLTQELIGNSSDTNRSIDSDSRLSTRLRARPVPAPRRKRVSKSCEPQSILAFDNEAFRSDNEEVLRIETEVYEPEGTSGGSKDFKQSTKIEMTKLYDSYEKVLDKETAVFHSESEFSGRESTRVDVVETFKTSKFADTSDELETEVLKVKHRENSKVSVTSRKSRRLLDAGSTFDTSEISENEEIPNDKVSRSKVSEKRKKNEKLKSKIRCESESFDTGNSITDISDLPSSKSIRESCRSKSKQRGSEKDDDNRKRRSKRNAKNDDLIESHNEDKEERLTSVTIHKADVLETDFITRHPMVKVHIVEMKTGNYLKTRNGEDRVRCSYLQPMITRKFDFKENRSIVPNWEEELIFEYDFDEVIQSGDKQILILFEILDLLNFAEASFKYNLLGNEGCWHKIAWAFLRPVGVNGTLHANKKVRLQLYEPSTTSRKSGRLTRCEVFNWWRSTTREKYPSTLYVTLTSVEPPIEEPILYERLSLNELPEIENESHGSCKKSSELLKLPKWTRLAAQSCKIPNNQLFESEAFENGSFYLTFSNNGKYLAFIGSEEGNYPIIVYVIPEGKICVRFVGHKNFVYSLNWSNNDKYLLSVSSDQTACIWDVANKIIQHIHMLPHPSYVYCGKFYPGTKQVVVTGCYDCVVRVWAKSKNSKRYELIQELDEHKGYVNSLCFQKDGSLITADSVGTIILWTVIKRGNTSSTREWRLLRIIKNNEIQNIVINTVALHPLGSRLLVHSRDNGLRMLDLATGIVLQRYKGLRNQRLQAAACLSPCGGLVLCGGEDSYLTVWSLENGRCLAKYLIRDAKIVACVAYHPLDHILAFSTFGSISAIQILNYDKNSTGENVGLSFPVDNDTIDDSDNVEITMKFDKSDFALTDRGLNFNANYSGRRIAGLSKRGGRLGSEIDKSYRMNQKLSTEIKKDLTNENSLSRQEFLRLKIQRLNDTEEGLKSRSAARLNNIIEKIDRILVNTTLKQDLDSTSSSIEVRKQEMGRISSNSKRETSSKNKDKIVSRSWKSRNRNKSSTSNTDATMELCNVSTEFIEMQNICYTRNEMSEAEELNNSNRRLSHSKSRVSTSANISVHSDIESEEEHSIYQSSSESDLKASREENKFDADIESNRERNAIRRRRRRRSREKRRSGSAEKKTVSNTETCIVVLENTKELAQSNPSTSDSAGTYTIDKSNFSKPWEDVKNKNTDTSSSAISSATFIIENEISSVPRSAKKERARLLEE